MDNQKGFIPILIALLIAAAIGGYFYFGKINLNRTQSTVITSSVEEKDETNNFPVYPSAKFIKKGVQNDPCDRVGDKTVFCSSTTYSWETTDDFDMVNNWYMKDKSNSGWECTGGAGSYDGPRDASSKTTCSNGNLQYGLTIKADSQKTEIILGIPTNNQ